MNPDRKIIAIDTETYLIKAGVPAPRIVCLSYAGLDEQPGLLTREDAIRFVHQLLDDDWELVGQNFRYDVICLCTEDFSLFPKFVRAYEEGRIHDIGIRDTLHHLGTQGLYDEEESEDGEAKPVRRQLGFSMADMVKRRFNVDLSGDKAKTKVKLNADGTENVTVVGDAESWRLRYSELDGVPLSMWPIDARTYACDDAVWTIKVWKDQPEVIVNADMQTLSAFWLGLMGAYGVRTDPEMVVALEKKLQHEYRVQNAVLIEAGLLKQKKVKGVWTWSKDMRALRRLVALSYGGEKALATLEEIYRNQDMLSSEKKAIAKAKTQAASKLKRENKAREKQGLPPLEEMAITLPTQPETDDEDDEDGDDTPKVVSGVPMTEKGQVATDRDTLVKLAHPEALKAVKDAYMEDMPKDLDSLQGEIPSVKPFCREAGALFMIDHKEFYNRFVMHEVGDRSGVEKLLKTFIPVLLQGTQVPINPRWNVLVATGRTSCVAKGTFIEVVRDVSAQPRGVPVEDVKVGDLVYAFDDDGKVVLRPVTWAGKTGTKKVIRMHWRGNGNRHVGYVDLTPEHEVRHVSGFYRPASAYLPGDRVMAIARGVRKGPLGGYPYLYATGNKEIREHQFVFEQVHGYRPEAVHHKNENKADNRVENLDGMLRSDHHKLHGNNTSHDLRKKRSENQKRRWSEKREDLLETVLRGEEHPGWRGFTKEEIETLLWEERGRPLYVAKRLNTDYETLQRYMSIHDVDYLAIARCFTATGERITTEFVDKWRAEMSKIGCNKALPLMGIGFRRWRQVQEQYGFPAHNHEILFIEELPDPVDVYDLTVEGVHNFIANEICVHNCSKPNLQQLPRKGGVRECFIPRYGYYYIGADYSFVELCTLAEFCFQKFGFSKLGDAINAGLDPHLDFAAALMGIPYEEAEARLAADDPEVIEMRQGSKCADFGYPGGLGAESFREYARATYGLVLTPQRAEELKVMFYRKWPEVKKYHNYIGSLAGDQHEFTITQLYSNRKRAGCNYTSGANCVDFETEALTTRGWVKGPDLLLTDKLLTKNAETGALEWHHPTALHLYPDYEGPLVEFSSTRFSAVTTPDHRWLVYDKATGTDKCVVSSKLSRHGDHRIHRTGKLDAPDGPYDSDFLELAGWLLTDGSISREPGSTRINIYQTKPDNVTRIDALFARMGLKVGRSVREGGAVVWRLTSNPRTVTGLSASVKETSSGTAGRKGHTIEDYLRAGAGVDPDLVVASRLGVSLPGVRWMRKHHGIPDVKIDGKGVSTRLRNLFPERIMTPEFVATLSHAQARHLMDVMILGDGTTTENGQQKFFTRHEESSDAVQMLLVLAGQASKAEWRDMTGYAATQKQYASMPNMPKMSGIWNVCPYRRDKVQVVEQQVREFVDKRGVWCPAVPNTYFVARRNKTVYITGNTLFQGLAADGAKLAGWMIMRECYLEEPYSDIRYERLLEPIRAAVDILQLSGESPLYGSRPTVFAHDEVIAESEIHKAPEAGDRLAQVMIECMQVYTPHVKIRSEATITPRWLKGAKSIRDENGRLKVWTPKPKK